MRSAGGAGWRRRRWLAHGAVSIGGRGWQVRGQPNLAPTAVWPGDHIFCTQDGFQSSNSEISTDARAGANAVPYTVAVYASWGRPGRPAPDQPGVSLFLPEVQPSPSLHSKFIPPSGINEHAWRYTGAGAIVHQSPLPTPGPSWRPRGCPWSRTVVAASAKRHSPPTGGSG
jgi:hypothetical protein